jgi:hypothetical protein
LISIALTPLISFAILIELFVEQQQQQQQWKIA